MTTELRRDQRGAVMVTSLFMSVFLVACVWHMVGVGDSILARERMMESGDSVAFSSAVIHARGMNAIAMMNVIMAALMAVLVAIKVSQLILVITAAVAAALLAASLGSCSPCAEALNASARGYSTLQSVLSTIEQPMLTAIEALSMAQKAVALATPWIGQAEAMQLGKFFTAQATGRASPVKLAVTASPSMIPSEDEVVTLGLPVQEDDPSRLCDRAAAEVPPFAWLPADLVLLGDAPVVHAFGGPATLAIPALVKSASQQYCSGGGADTMGVVAGTGSTAVKDACGSSSKCTSRAGRALGDQLKASQSTTQYGGGGNSGRTTKRVSAGVKNGAGHMQVWGLALGPESEVGTATRIVSIATYGRKPARAGDTTFSFSAAEMYFECRGDWQGRDCNANEGAMWDLRWRARTRTARFPGGRAGAILMAAIGTVVPSFLERGGGDAQRSRQTQRLASLGTLLLEEAAKEWFSASFLHKLQAVRSVASMPGMRRPDPALVSRLENVSRVIAH